MWVFWVDVFTEIVLGGGMVYAAVGSLPARDKCDGRVYFFFQKKTRYEFVSCCDPLPLAFSDSEGESLFWLVGLWSLGRRLFIVAHLRRGKKKRCRTLSEVCP